MRMKRSARAAAVRKKTSSRIARCSIHRMPRAVERWPEMWSMWNAPSGRDCYERCGPPAEGEDAEAQAWIERQIDEEFERSELRAAFEIEAPEMEELPARKRVVTERAYLEVA